jgi:hypothetical protein
MWVGGWEVKETGVATAEAGTEEREDTRTEREGMVTAASVTTEHATLDAAPASSLGAVTL